MKEQKTRADIIRQVAEDEGFSHSNNWIKKYILRNYNLEVSVQQVASVLGRYKDRKYVDGTIAHRKCRELLNACANDYNLAKKILCSYVGV
tara:strand:+ start:1500 stop:1772 length:273 start_codon:yes stop_codon:yes gene_type:complete